MHRLYLFNLAWNFTFSDSSLTKLSCFTSDHVPLIITLSTSIPRSRQFRFERFWAFCPACHQIVAQACQSNGPTHKSSSAILARTLQASFSMSQPPNILGKNRSMCFTTRARTTSHTITNHSFLKSISKPARHAPPLLEF